MGNFQFFNVISTFLYHFSVFSLLRCVSLLLILPVLGGLKKFRNPNSGPRWPIFRNHGVIPASSAHDAALKGNNFGLTIQPQSFNLVALIFSELEGGFWSLSYGICIWLDLHVASNDHVETAALSAMAM